MMKPKIRAFLLQRLWMILLILSYLLMSYYYFGGWWNSSVGTLLILFFSYLRWKKDFLQVIGLKLDYKIGVKSLCLAAIITIFAFLLMVYIAANQNISIKLSNWRNYFHDIFYILNEEIVIGAMTLYILIHNRKFRPIVASIGLAIAFSLIHYVFYRWIFNDRGILQASTLITLFLIGIVRNNLILATGHIGYSWALHFGWMAVMFGSFHVYSNTQMRVIEPARFNIYLGSIEMLIISIVIVALSLVHWTKKVKTTITVI